MVDKGFADVFNASVEKKTLTNSLKNFSLTANIKGDIINVEVSCLGHVCHGVVTEKDGVITNITGAHLFRYSELINENTYKLSRTAKQQLSKKCFFKKGIDANDVYNMMIRSFKIADFKQSEDNPNIFLAYVKTNSTISTDKQSVLCACIRYIPDSDKYVCCSFYPCFEVPKWYGSVSKTINVS